jgi:hypothetical protein
MSMELLLAIHGNIKNLTPDVIEVTAKEMARQQAKKLFHQEKLLALTTKSENPVHDMYRMIYRTI